MNPNTFNSYGETHIGMMRKQNEDSFLIVSDLKAARIGNRNRFSSGALGSVLLVADGLGGADAGDVAADLAIDFIVEKLQLLNSIPTNAQAIFDLLSQSIIGASQEIATHSASILQCKNMGSTLVLAWIIDSVAYIAWVGDSRAYIYNENKKLELLTEDHSLVWQMVKEGKIDAEQARKHPKSNIVTQCLGYTQYPPKASVLEIILEKGDRLMLCTDGLNSMLADKEIEFFFNKKLEINDLCKTLIAKANEAGGHDNITILLFDVIDVEKNPTLEQKFAKKIADSVGKPDLKEMILPVLLGTGILCLLLISFLVSGYHRFFNIDSDQTEQRLIKVLNEVNDQHEDKKIIPSKNVPKTWSKNEVKTEKKPEPILPPKTETPKMEIKPVINDQESADLKKKLKILLDLKQAHKKRIDKLKMSALNPDKNKQINIIEADFKTLWPRLQMVADGQSALKMPKDVSELQKIQNALSEVESILKKMEADLKKIEK